MSEDVTRSKEDQMSDRCLNCGGYAPPLDNDLLGGCTCEGDYRAPWAVPPPEWAVEQYLEWGWHARHPAVVEAAREQQERS